MSDDYEVGKGKPPKHSRFKQGKSGNPSGRRKGSKNKKPSSRLMRQLNELILQEAARPVAAAEDGKRIEIPTVEGILRQMAKNAFKGSHVAQRDFLKMAKSAENEQLNDQLSMLEAVVNYRKAAWEEIERAEQMDLKGPDPIPHPENIDICYPTGQVTITGPFSVSDQKKLEKWRAEKSAFDTEIVALTAELELAEGADNKALVKRDIAQANDSRAFIDNMIDQLVNRKIVSGG